VAAHGCDHKRVRRFRYRVVTGRADQFQEQLTALGNQGWRVVAAAPGGESWSAIMEQDTAAGDPGTGRTRAWVEVRDAAGT
jgi:hypothetical protein